MSVPGERPHPVPTPLTEPYWASCRAGVLSIQRCASCRRYVHFPEERCPFCGGGSLAYEAVSGRGRVVTHTTVHRPFVPGFAGLAPYTVAWVELEEQPGLRAFGGLLGHPPGTEAIGLPVEVAFTDLPGFGPIPDFRPRREGER
ncbi:Zn-ribbon domain-containing OB-fold protein [Nocardiopsis potens]|uniref:Zn-ribbon domain-containing OB-fold protein n=1 Tax=Nocardiopsis potens TaxID=1246458 RepID=UPI000349339F|nr:OB-fold domain-containing protein [Nocardiopsis potens]